MGEARPVHGGTLIWLSGLLPILFVHALWCWLNAAPPIWDMAYHQWQGWQYLEAWRQGQLLEQFAELSPSYPPLYYLVEAVVLGWLGDGWWLAWICNLPALILLSAGSWRLSQWCFEPGHRLASAVSGWLVLLFPSVAWISRETVLDVQLAGLATLGALLILSSQLFQRLPTTLLFGLVCAGGVLTKWTFPLYLAFPVLWALWSAENRRLALKNLSLAAAGAFFLVLPYYAPHLNEMMARYPTTEQAGIIPWKPYPRHGEPGLNNLLGWIYYPRIFASYYLQLPLSLLFLAGLFRKGAAAVGTGTDAARAYRLLWIWLLGGIFFLIFLTPKDPRFALPLATPLALLLVGFWGGSRRWLAVLTLVAGLQFLSVSFESPLGPFKLAFFERKGDRDFQTLQQEWVLWQSHYLEITGPPRRELWPNEDIVSLVPEGARVGFLPELPRFHPEGLQLAATRMNRNVAVVRLGESPHWQAQLETVDFVVAKSGHQGISFITQFNEPIEGELLAQQWSRAGQWFLPDGTQASLWKRQVYTESR